MFDLLRCTVVLGLAAVLPVLAEEPESQISFTTPVVVVNEASGSVGLQVLRTGIITNIVSVDYSVAQASAVAGEDYTPQSGTLTFNEGETNLVITIPILDDAVFENAETFRVLLGNPSAGASVGAQAAVVVAIEDNDHAAGIDETFEFAPIAYYPPDDVTEITRVIALEDSTTFYGSTTTSPAPTIGLVDREGNGIRASGVGEYQDGVRDVDGSFYLTGQHPYGIGGHYSGQVGFDSALGFMQRAGLTGQGNAIQLTSERLLLVGGSFFEGTDTNLFGLARLFRNGTRDETFSTDEFAGREVTALAVTGDLFYAATTRTNESAEVAHTLGRYLADGARDNEFAEVSFNGRVEVLHLLADGTILAGGQFTEAAGVAQPHLAKVTAAGDLDADWQPAPPDGVVYSIASEADGGLLVGGSFSQVNGTARGSLARLTPAGALDEAFDAGSGPNGRIRTIAVQPDGAILVGGRFTEFSGVRSKGLVRLKGGAVNGKTYLYWERRLWTVQEQAGSATLSLLRAGGTDEALTVQIQITGGTASAGADYGSIPSELTFQPGERELEIVVPLVKDGAQESRETMEIELAAEAQALVISRGTTELRIQDAESPGSRDVSFEFSGTQVVTTIAVQEDGKILVGGETLVRLLPDGTPDASFRADVFTNHSTTLGYNQIYTILPAGDHIYVGGSFIFDANGLQLWGLLRLMSDGTLDTEFATPLVGGGISGPVTAVMEMPTGLVLAGISGTFPELKRLHAYGSRDHSYRPPHEMPRSSINRLIPHPEGGYLVAGYGQPVSRLDVTATIVTNFASHLAGGAYGIRQYQDGFFVNGDMRVVATDEPVGLLLLNLDGTINTNFAADVNGPVEQAVPLQDGRILISGSFTRVDGIERNRIARLHADGSLDTTFNPGLGLDARAFALAGAADGKALVGGPNQAHYDGEPVGPLIRLTDLPEEGEIRFAQNAMAVNEEEGGVRISVERVGGSTGDLAAEFVTLDGSASAGVHFGGTNFVVEFADGRFVAQEFTIPIFANAEYTGDKVFQVQLLGDGGVVLDETTITIVDAQEYPYPGEFRFRTRNLVVSENAGEAVFVIERVGGHSGLIQAQFSTWTQSARAGVHFGETNLVIQFADGDTEPKEVAIPLYADPELTGHRTFAVRLTDTTSGATLDETECLIFDAQEGTLDPEYPPLPAVQLSMVRLFEDGSVILGGPFAHVRAQPIRFLARLNPDGAVDTSFAMPTPPLSPVQIRALDFQPDGKIVVGGNFLRWDSASIVYHVARLNTDLTLDQEFSTVADDAVRKGISYVSGVEVLSNGDILVNDGNKLSRLDSTGAGKGAAISVGTPINDFEVLPGGEILVGSRTLRKVTADWELEPEPWADVSHEDSPNGTSVRTIRTLEDGSVLIGGRFTHVNGTNRALIAKLTPEGELDPAFDAGAITGTTYTNAVLAIEPMPDGDIIIGGHFETIQGVAQRHLARLGPDGSLRTAWNHQLRGNHVGQIQLLNSGGIMIHGSFTNAGGALVTNLARLQMSPNRGPLVGILSPEGGFEGSASEALAVKIDAFDFDGFLQTVRLLVDGVVRAEFSEPPYETSLTLEPGTYTLQAEAVDAAGLAMLSREVEITITEEATPVEITLGPAAEGGWEIALPGRAGVSYQLQSSGDLVVWEDVGEPVAGAEAVRFPVVVESEGHLFYRVVGKVE